MKRILTLMLSITVEATAVQAADALDSSTSADPKNLPSTPTGAESGFVSLFNGRDFSGWEMNTNFWSVSNGVINLHLDGTKGDPALGSIKWLGQAFDFELRLRCRLVGRIGKDDGELHLAYRDSTNRPYRQQSDHCYYTEIRNGETCGNIMQQQHGRAFYPQIVMPSQRRTIRPGDARQPAAIQERVTPAATVHAAFTPDEWNDVVVTATGSHVVVSLNGVRTAELFDEDAANRPAGGVITLSGFRRNGKLLQAQFKDIRLRRLSAGTGASTLPMADAITAPVHLLDGKSLDSFYSWIRGRGRDKDPSGVFSLKDGLLQIRPMESGYLSTKNAYSDYRLVAEFKWGDAMWGQYKNKARGSGIYVHAVGEDAINSFVPNSLQVQIAEGATGDIELAGGKLNVPGVTPRDGWIFERPGKHPYKNETGFRGPTELEKPHGEWNVLEITCDHTEIKVRVNGTLTLHGTNAAPHAGRILIEAGNADIFFRRVDLLPLK